MHKNGALGGNRTHIDRLGNGSSIRYTTGAKLSLLSYNFVRHSFNRRIPIFVGWECKPRFLACRKFDEECFSS